MCIGRIAQASTTLWEVEQPSETSQDAGFQDVAVRPVEFARNDQRVRRLSGILENLPVSL